jgi:hypothetical protein
MIAIMQRRLSVETPSRPFARTDANCACVGGNAKTPLGVVSFAENLIMAAMGAAMLAGG